MLELQEEKVKIQVEAVQAIAENNGGIVAIATGGGKSKIAIDYIRIREIAEQRKLSILLVVPTEKLRDENWKGEFIEWNNNGVYDRVDRYCYASINKLRHKHYDVAIFDEIQNITENNAEFFTNNEVDTLIALTATVPKEHEKAQILREQGLKVVYELSLDEAVKRGVVAPYQITTVGFHLDDKDKYIKAGSKVKSWMTTEVKQYQYLASLVSKAVGAKKKFAALTRMHFLYGLKSREIAAKYLLKFVIPENERTLIFAGNIVLAENLESNSFHSKSNDVAYNKFMKEEINRLSSVKSLNEGMNIPNLDNALIAQINSKERHLIQKIGRIVRFRPGHIANIYIMYAMGTVDREWLIKSLDNIDKTNIKHITLKF